MRRLTIWGERKGRRGVGLGLILVAFGAGAVRCLREAPPEGFRPGGAGVTVAPDRTVASRSEEAARGGLRTDFVSLRAGVRTHAASLVELKNGDIRAFWYAGTNEGTRDVTIRTAVLETRTSGWGPERVVTSRERTQEEVWRYVKKLGNPVVSRAPDGALWLFYVTVSVGGWAGSSITMIRSQDDGETWEKARRLVTSPFLNISTLVKGPAITYTDGTMGLPVHHEFLGKFGELLRIDAQGDVVDKVRLSSGREALQPLVLVRDENRALVLMRYAGKARPRRVLSTTTGNAGRTWTAPTGSLLPNSDAALAGMVLADGRMLVALNDTEERRERLSLVVSSDGGASWRTIYRVEDQSEPAWQGLNETDYAAVIERLGEKTVGARRGASDYASSVKRVMFSKQGNTFEFSYPSLIRASGGDFHLAYTWNEAFIKHVQFSQAWLDERLQADARLH
ncbi:MAG: hypothetical protein RL077_6349 [Verrucomicrobiota bacterium]